MGETTPTTQEAAALRERAREIVAALPAGDPLADAIREILALQDELEAVTAERDELRDNVAWLSRAIADLVRLDTVREAREDDLK